MKYTDGVRALTARRGLVVIFERCRATGNTQCSSGRESIKGSVNNMFNKKQPREKVRLLGTTPMCTR